jgi:hypothetical protein
MKALDLSFEQWKKASAAAIPAVIQAGRGIVHPGPHANSPERRFNSRALQRCAWCEVKYFIEETPIGAKAVIFTDDGMYWGQADEKRGYYPLMTAFHNALDFDAKALKRLYRDGPIGWHGKPWHVHLAATACAILFEPPPKALPWHGGAK